MQPFLQPLCQLGGGRTIEAIHPRMATVAAIDILLQELGGAISTGAVPFQEPIKGGTHNSGVNITPLRQPFQRQCHYARRPLDRDSFDLSEREKKGGEKEGKTELHCGGEKI